MKAKFFYGVKLDHTNYPSGVTKLLEKWGNPEEALSIHLLKEGGYTIDNEYDAEEELARKTAIRVLDLGDFGTYLALEKAITSLDSHGVTKADMAPTELGEQLRMEVYAKRLGTNALGNTGWSLWGDHV
jgi:hypothetical protein